MTWRAVGEERAELQGPRFASAAVLVRAFEDLRYGERDPDGQTLDAARNAVAAIEAPG